MYCRCIWCICCVGKVIVPKDALSQILCIFVFVHQTHRLLLVTSYLNSILSHRVSTEYPQSIPIVSTEWQWPLSGVHYIMMVKSSQPGVGGGCTSSLFHSVYHHEQSCGVRPSWEGRCTPPYFSSTPICTLCSLHRATQRPLRCMPCRLRKVKNYQEGPPFKMGRRNTTYNVVIFNKEETICRVTTTILPQHTVSLFQSFISWCTHRAILYINDNLRFFFWQLSPWIKPRMAGNVWSI